MLKTNNSQYLAFPEHHEAYAVHRFHLFDFEGLLALNELPAHHIDWIFYCHSYSKYSKTASKTKSSQLPLYTLYSNYCGEKHLIKIYRRGGWWHIIIIFNVNYLLKTFFISYHLNF